MSHSTELIKEMLETPQAHEVAGEMHAEKKMPEPNDPRYLPFLEPWDGYQAPEIRWKLLIAKRRMMRKEAIRKAQEYLENL